MTGLGIEKVWVDSQAVYALAKDGRQANYRFADWPRLRNATPEQRTHFTLSHCGIHWPDVDEDLSFDGMFGCKD